MTAPAAVLEEAQPKSIVANPQPEAATVSVAELLAELNARDVRLWLDGDQLRVDAPKGALTPELLKQLKSVKAEVMSLLSAPIPQPTPQPKVEPLPKDSDERIRPGSNNPTQLTSAQQHLWQLEQLNPGTSLYNITEALHLQGRVDFYLLEESIRRVIVRHKILRTAFLRAVDGQPRAQVTEHIPTDIISFQRMEAAPISVIESNLRMLIMAEAQQIFNLAQAPLLHCLLVEIAEHEYMLVVTMHHIVSDALSFAIFMEEVSEIYRSLHHGMTVPLQPLAVQYGDYAQWQQRRLSDGSLASQQAFWTEKLSGELQPLQLPCDRASYASSYQSERQSVRFFAELSEQLRALARQEKVTLFVLLLAAFQSLLNRYSGQEDLLICAPVSGRNRMELEELIGYFNNILVLRSDLSGNPTFRELLRRVRTTVLEASERQDVPFAEIVNLPSLRRVPLSRALFELREVKAHALHLSGVRVTPLTVEKGSSDFDLFLILYERAGELSCVVHSKSDLFSSEAIDTFLGNFQSLLQQIVAEPGLLIAELARFGGQETGGQKAAGQKAAERESEANQSSQPDVVTPAVEALRAQLTPIWRQVLGVQSIQVTDNFFALGGHSLLAVQLIAEIERQLVGEKLPLALLLQAPTIAQLAEVLANKGWRSSWSSLVPIQPKGERRPFFFVHAHGGNVLGYYDLARHLGDDQPFYGLQAMGMETGEKVTRRLEEMAAHYIAEIRTLQPQGPYLLGGWCLGGDVAFEMAQQLQAQGQEVALLVMVHNPLPGYPRPLPGCSAMQKRFYRLRARFDREWCNFYEVASSQKAAYLVERGQSMWQRLQIKFESRFDPLLRRLGVAHSQVYEKEVLADAHLKAYAAYSAKAYAGNVLLIRAQKQPLGTESDWALGWDTLITGKLAICGIPGYPIGLLDEPRVKQVAAAVANALSNALKAQ